MKLTEENILTYKKPNTGVNQSLPISALVEQIIMMKNVGP